jgi:cytidylate kinase
MEWESNMTKDQKEQYVLELFQQGRTVRHIAQLTHMSFREIGTITKAYKDEIDDKMAN